MQVALSDRYSKADKSSLIVMGLYTIVYIFWMTKRNLAGYELGNSGVSQLNFLSQILPFLVFVPLFALASKKQNVIGKLWTLIAERLEYIVFPILGACVILTVFNVPGVGWTWTSFGFMAGSVLVGAKLIESRLPAGEALVLTWGLVSFSLSIWEMPFRLLAYFTHDYQFFPAGPFLSYAVLQQIPNILGSLYIIWFYNRKYKLLNFNNGVLITGIAMLACWIGWIALGFWVAEIWDGKAITYAPVSNTTYLQNVLHQSTKVLINAMMILSVLKLGKSH